MYPCSHLALPGFSCDDLVGLMRETCWFASRWGLDLVVSGQDVRTAFDSVGHGSFVDVLLGSGAKPISVLAIAREYFDARARLEIKDVAQTDYCPFSKALRTGSKEAPPIFNQMVRRACGSLVRSWEARKLGFCLPESDRQITHAWWADNLFLFSCSFGNWTTMVDELTGRIAMLYGWIWKPSSLEVMLVNVQVPPEFLHEGGVTIPVTSCPHHPNLFYPIRTSLIALGSFVSRDGECTAALDHRLGFARKHFFRHRPLLMNSSLPLFERLDCWRKSVQSTATFGSGSWHINKKLILQAKSWELQMLRMMFRMRGLLAQVSYTLWLEVTAARIRKWLGVFRVISMPLRIIRAVFKQAWRETSQSHLAGLVRSERSDQWWERIKHEPGRHREGLKQSRQGKWPGFEEPFVIAFGSDWRSLRDACASLAEWRQYERKFVHVLSTAWCLDWLWCEYDTLFPESVNTGSEPAVTQPKHMRFPFESLRLPPVHDQDTLRGLAQAKRQIECVVDNEQVCKATVGLSSISDTTMHGFLQHMARSQK